MHLIHFREIVLSVTEMFASPQDPYHVAVGRAAEQMRINEISPVPLQTPPLPHTPQFESNIHRCYISHNSPTFQPRNKLYRLYFSRKSDFLISLTKQNKNTTQRSAIVLALIPAYAWSNASASASSMVQCTSSSVITSHRMMSSPSSVITAQTTPRSWFRKSLKAA